MNLMFNSQIQKAFLLSIIISMFISIFVAALMALLGGALGSMAIAVASAVASVLIVAGIFKFRLVSPMQSGLAALSARVSGDAAGADSNDKALRQSALLRMNYTPVADLIDGFYDTTSDLAASGSNVAIAAAEVSFTADTLKNSLHEEVAHFGGISSSASHISSIVSESTVATHAASVTADETFQASQKGLSDIHNAIEQMQTTDQQAKQTAEYVSSLAEKSDQIQEITSVISGIAEQTNLLALNAAIEAARAGDQGRGFAVVADEVRNLAYKTSQATDEIGAMVTAIGNSIQQAESTMSELAASIDEGVSKTRTVGDSLQSISDFAQSMQQQVNEIQSGAANNNQQVEQISGSIESVNQHLQKTESEVVSVAEEANKLAGMAEKILSLVLKFEKNSIHRKMVNYVQHTAAEIGALFEDAINKGQISESDLFDRDYKPIEGTNPTKYSTRFDQFTDRVLPAIQEPLLSANKEMLFAGAVDNNGYFPTHNKKYSQPLTGNYEKDLVNNRTKRIFNDPTGSRCGSHTDPFLVQTYKRDTGEILHDISAPIYVNGRHWGGFRMGYLSG